MAKQETAVHVQLDNSLDLRKKVLQTAIDSAQLLQDYNAFTKVYQMKKVKMGQLDKILTEIKNKGKDLDRSKFPQLPTEEKVKIAKKEFEVPVSIRESSDVDKLKRELAEIESKLKSL